MLIVHYDSRACLYWENSLFKEWRRMTGEASKDRSEIDEYWHVFSYFVPTPVNHKFPSTIT